MQSQSFDTEIRKLRWESAIFAIYQENEIYVDGQLANVFVISINGKDTMDQSMVALLFCR